MSDKKTVLLLDFLLEGASGEEREALSAAYQRAFSETEEYRALRQLLNDTLFTGPRGSELFSVGAGALEKGMTHTGEFDTVSASMRYVLENSRQLLAETNACIHTLRMDPRRLQLIDKRDASALRAFLTALVNELCYFVTALYGPGLLAGFRFDPGQGAADMLAAVNGGITNVLNRLADAPAPRAWRITRQQFGGANLVRFNGVCLHYDITQRQMEAELTRQTPFLYTPRENGDLLCAGVGLLTNLKPENGAAVLGASDGVITRLDARAFTDQSFNYNGSDVCGLLDRTLNGGICAVEPAQFVSALNRFLMNAAVVNRVNLGRCPFCGGANNTCVSHFYLPEPEGGFQKLFQNGAGNA